MDRRGRKLTGEWRKLHKEKRPKLYSSPNNIRMITSRRMRWAGYVALMGEIWKTYKILVGKLEVNKQLGRRRSRWEDNIKMDPKKKWQGVHWIHLAQERGRGLLKIAMRLQANIKVPYTLPLIFLQWNFLLMCLLLQSCSYELYV
jgi:hypothetical protein